MRAANGCTWPHKTNRLNERFDTSSGTTRVERVGEFVVDIWFITSQNLIGRAGFVAVWPVSHLVVSIFPGGASEDLFESGWYIKAHHSGSMLKCMDCRAGKPCFSSSDAY